MGPSIPGITELIVLLYLALFFGLPVAGIWKTFEKAGKPGWAAIIPIYNLYIMAKIGKVGVSWVLLALVPYIGFIAILRLAVGVAKAFDAGTLFGIGMGILPWIGWPLLGFRGYEYQPSTEPTT